MAHLRLNQEDNNGTVEVEIGDTITIEVPESPTGYRWTIDRDGKPELEFQRTDFSGAQGGGVGGGGRRTFTFGAVKKGSGTISLKHWREWEGESSVNKRFSVKIKVM